MISASVKKELSYCLKFLIIYKKCVQVNFCGKCCQEIKLKMIILRKLEILTFLRIVVTYHFEYTAAALNPVVFCLGKYL